VPEPEDLLLRIRVAISHERARRRHTAFHAMNLAWRNTVGPFMLQAAAGFASAVLLLGTVIVLVSMFAQPESAQATADEPLGMATAPRFLYLSSVVGGNPIGDVSVPVVIEAYVNPQGQVYDYRIVSGPSIRPPASRSRTCFCGAASSRPAASDNLSQAWLFSPSPASPCADKRGDFLQPATLVKEALQHRQPLHNRPAIMMVTLLFAAARACQTTPWKLLIPV